MFFNLYTKKHLDTYLSKRAKRTYILERSEYIVIFFLITLVKLKKMSYDKNYEYSYSWTDGLCV
jgi:hypothetical protein